MQASEIENWSKKRADEPERGAASPQDISLYLAYRMPARWYTGLPSGQSTTREMPRCRSGARAFRVNSKYREYFPLLNKYEP